MRSSGIRESSGWLSKSQNNALLAFLLTTPESSAVTFGIRGIYPKF